MNEHTWTAGGFKYRAGKPQNMGGLGANSLLIQRQIGMSVQWETVASDPAVAEEMLRLADIAAKASGKR